MSLFSNPQLARRSERVTQQPARLLDVAEVYVAPTTHLRNVACKRKAVTAEMRAIGLRPDGKKTILNRVSASRALRLLKQLTRILSTDWANV